MQSRNWKTYAAILSVAGLGVGITAIETLAEAESVSVFEFLFDSVEKALIVTGAFGVFHLLRTARKDEQQRLSLLKELEIAKVEGQEWRDKAQTFVSGVGHEIENQFENWSLSDAESEVGLFMIKGLSHKEIADLRGTAEATVRQQARSIYSKSGLPGKAAFSAYFLEDLLPPRTQTNGSDALQKAVRLVVKGERPLF